MRLPPDIRQPFVGIDGAGARLTARAEGEAAAGGWLQRGIADMAGGRDACLDMFVWSIAVRT